MILIHRNRDILCSENGNHPFLFVDEELTVGGIAISIRAEEQGCNTVVDETAVWSSSLRAGISEEESKEGKQGDVEYCSPHAEHEEEELLIEEERLIEEEWLIEEERLKKAEGEDDEEEGLIE